MDWIIEHWTTLIGPAVVAAAISSIVTVIGFFITTGAAKAMHREKLAFDQKLAERKFEFDKELTEQKFKYDRHKRKAELAEAVLADFYRVEEIYRGARAPFIFNCELGPKEGVSDEVASDRCFATARRLMEYEEYFGRFRARRHEFAAIFGKDAAAPFDVVRKVNTDIHWATDCLLRHKEVITSHEPSELEQYKEWSNIIWSSEANDEITGRLSSAVSQIETTCRPAIEASAHTP